MYTLEDSANAEVTNAKTLVRRVRLSIDHGGLPALRLIEIQAIGSTVVLAGRVATFHQKQLATSLAGRVAGVVEVMNRLDVLDGWTNNNLQHPIGLSRQSQADGKVDSRLKVSGSS